MSDFDGGAAAPADSGSVSSNEGGGVPIQENAAREQGLGSQTPVAEKPPAPEPTPKAEAKPEPSKSNREALEKAFSEVKAKREADKSEPLAKEAAPKEPPKPEAARSEDGRFAPKDGAQSKAEAAPQATQNPGPQASQNSPHREAPARFDDAAKAEWASAPESVKGAIHRTIRELEQGHQKYRESAERYEVMRPHAEWVEKNGGDVKQVFDDYVRLNHMIMTNPVGALEEICRMQGFSLRQVAEHVMGQTPDQQASQRDQEIIGLKQQLAALQRQVGGVTETFQKQQNDATLSQVQAFAAMPEHSRFDELADDIGFFLTSGRTSDLAEAYKLAERLNPAPSPSRPLIPADNSAPAQTRTEGQPNPAGQKSISGAPSSGSDPTRFAPPSKSNREALLKALGQQGR